jgi:hypothetical protein
MPSIAMIFPQRIALKWLDRRGNPLVSLRGRAQQGESQYLPDAA